MGSPHVSNDRARAGVLLLDRDVTCGWIPNGSRRLVELESRRLRPCRIGGSPSDLVTLPGGITTTLENATRLGFVRNDKLHGYVNASEAQFVKLTAQASASAPRLRPRLPRRKLRARPRPTLTRQRSSKRLTRASSARSPPRTRSASCWPSTAGSQLPRRSWLDVAEQLGQQPEQAQETLNNMAMGVQAQFQVMAKAQGLDPDQAADWIRTHRSDRVAAALQQHTLHRDVIGAWSRLLADVKRATAARG